MARNVIAVIIGIIVAGVVIFSVQQVNERLFPLPDGLTIEDREGMIAHIKTLPTLAFIIVLLSYLLGTIAGCFVALKIASSHFLPICLIVAGFLLIMSIINLITIPHPLWFSLVNLAIYIPTALFIHKQFRPK